LALLAALRLKEENLEAAEKWYLRGREAFPRSDRWDKGLARIYLTGRDDEKLTPVLVRLAAQDQDSLPIRKKLAELALARQDWPEARRWAREALHRDVSDAETHALLAQAAAGAEQFAVAAEEYAVAVQLDGERPEWRLAWGRVLLRNGKKEEAHGVLRDLQDKTPNLPGLSQLLEESQP
jgi:Tfp pilus assembly protein PilF